MWVDVSILAKVIQLYHTPKLLSCQQFCLPSAFLLAFFPTTKCIKKHSSFTGSLSFSRISTNNHFFNLPFLHPFTINIRFLLELHNENSETGLFTDDTCQVQNKHVIQQRRKELSQEKKKRHQDLSLKLTKASFPIQNINYLLECHVPLGKRRFGISGEPSNVVSSFVMIH